MRIDMLTYKVLKLFNFGTDELSHYHRNCRTSVVAIKNFKGILTTNYSKEVAYQISFRPTQFSSGRIYAAHNVINRGYRKIVFVIY